MSGWRCHRGLLRCCGRVVRNCVSGWERVWLQYQLACSVRVWRAHALVANMEAALQHDLLESLQHKLSWAFECSWRQHLKVCEVSPAEGEPDQAELEWTEAELQAWREQLIAEWSARQRQRQRTETKLHQNTTLKLLALEPDLGVELEPFSRGGGDGGEGNHILVQDTIKLEEVLKTPRCTGGAVSECGEIGLPAECQLAVRSLVRMGFESTAAQEAAVSSQGDVSLAVNKLLTGGVIVCQSG